LELLASIDLMRGRVARLRRGNPYESSFYDKMPTEYAARWKEAGFGGLHLVDLDAALGLGDNTESVGEILANSSLTAQVGGGVRSLERAGRLFKLGAARVVISSILFTDRNEAARMLAEFGPERVVASLDIDERGFVVVHGWQTRTAYRLVDALEFASNMGFTKLMVTDTSRDGTLSGVDSLRLGEIPFKMRRSIHVAGGIRDLRDLEAIKKMGFRGAVLGKALYEGGLDPREALKAAAEG